MRWRPIFIHIIFPLVCGLLIYILFRAPVTWLHSFLSIKQTIFSIPRNLISEFLLFQVPDMCWAYALTASLLLFTRLNKIQCAAISLICMSSIEYFQAGFRSEQLDYRDLTAMLLAVILSTILIIKYERSG